MITHSAYPRLYVFAVVQITAGQQPATRFRTACYHFSTSLFLLSVEHTARLFTCRPTSRVGFFVLSAFYSVAVTWRVSSAKIKRDNAAIPSHIVSRQR